MIQAPWRIVVLALATGAFYPCGAFANPLRCDVTEHSDAGGTVEVSTDENPAPAWFPDGNKPQIFWKPAPAPTSPQLVIKFADSTLKQMGKDPLGGHIRFRVPPPTVPDDTQVVLGLPDGETLVFQNEQLKYGHDYGSDDETQPAMDIDFSDGEAHWGAIKAAIKDGGRLSVKLVRNGKTLSQALFELGNYEARNALLGAAAKKIADADPKSCTTAPYPVMDMTSGAASSQ
jgi:hypothetical protein